MRLLFEPLDVMFFRDSRPFHAGESFSARSALPLPSVFYGAIRTHLLDWAGVDFAAYSTADDPTNWGVLEQREVIAAVGTPRRAGTFRLKGPLLSKEGFRLFQVPLDVVRFKEGTKEMTLLCPLIDPPAGWDPPLPGMKPLWVRDSRVFAPVAGFLTEEGICSYLEGKLPERTSCLEVTSLYKLEPRTGIELTEERTTAEGKFYAAEFLRFREGLSLVCEVDGLDGVKLNSGVISVGGERRMARLSVLGNAGPPAAPRVENRFKLILATPAIFKNGWCPSWVGEDALGKRDGVVFRLVAAAIGKPLVVSGFDLARHLPKPIRRAAPAGSVYYFELLEGNPQKLAKVFHFQTISDESPEAGFGLALLGGWSYA